MEYYMVFAYLEFFKESIDMSKHHAKDFTGISGQFFIQVRDASGCDRSKPISYEEIANLPIKREYKIHNKLLKRGLNYLYYLLFWRSGGVGVGDGWTLPDITSNPTTNPFQYFILSKSTARPDWNESNGSNNANAGPQGNGTPNDGTRGVQVSDTSGIFKQIQISQPSTPRKTMEVVFFAQDNPGSPQESGDWDCIDNFEFTCVGFAEGLDAGNGGTASKWGIRSLIGLAPTVQGVTDRVNVAEADPGTLTVNPGSVMDGYVEDTSQSVDGYAGDLAFDGYSQSEGLDGYLDLGGSWHSHAGASHYVGRIWASSKTITNFRIIIPAGININNVPKHFKAQELTGADPSNNSHWTDISLTVSTHTVDQSVNIYSAGDKGYEYTLTAPVTTNGFRLNEVEPVSATDYVAIGELHIYTAMSPVTIISGSNTLRISIDGGSNFREFTIADTGPTTSVTDLVNAINAEILGYELEAVRSDFGFLWIRGTTQGAVSELDLGSVAGGSNANTPLGIGIAGKSLVGTTESIIKTENETLTIIYRMDIGVQEGIDA